MIESEPMLADDLLPRIDAHTFFAGGRDHAILRQQIVSGRKLVSFVPEIDAIVENHVPMVTDDRMDVEYVVTELGVVNLRGRSTRERAFALIEIADPKSRDELREGARKITLI